MGAKTVIEFSNVDILFSGRGRRGTRAKNEALALMDKGHSRDEIIAKTGVVMGVQGASLKIREGEICVLMGLSGSGKSTLLRAVNGLNKVTRGRILVARDAGQVDMANCDATTLRFMRTRRIAMVFQQFALLPWRTVRENVGLGLELRGVSDSERRRIVTRAQARGARQMGRQVCARAFRRHAAARRPRPRLCDRCRYPADG